MYLIISTIPHFFSILPVLKYYRTQTFGYINVIILSTSFSILYHLFEEANHIINFIDYFLALLWLLYDIYLGYPHAKPLYKIILANSIVFILNIHIPYNQFYTLNHSLWHILNSYKSIYISNIINKIISN
jgi:hypothetical protein